MKREDDPVALLLRLADPLQVFGSVALVDLSRNIEFAGIDDPVAEKHQFITVGVLKMNRLGRVTFDLCNLFVVSEFAIEAFELVECRLVDGVDLAPTKWVDARPSVNLVALIARHPPWVKTRRS